MIAATLHRIRCTITKGRVSQLQPYRLGQHVQHATFGDGVILNLEGEGDNLRIQVHFHSAGVKWLLSQYACLKSQS